MNLKLVAATATEPATSFLWDSEENVLVEVVDLGDYALVRASKGLKILARNESEESRTRSLRKLTRYFSDTFPKFRVSVDFVSDVSPSVALDGEKVESLASRGKLIENELEDLRDRRSNLVNSLEKGFDELEGLSERRLSEVEGRIDDLEQRYEEVVSELSREQLLGEEWQKEGVMSTYVFQVFTDSELVHRDSLPEAVGSHISDIVSLQDRKIKQVLGGPNFGLIFSEVEVPSVLHRLEHTGLLNPSHLEDLIDSCPEGVESILKDLRDRSADQFMATALSDLEVDGSTVVRSKATPARSFESVLDGLESSGSAFSPDSSLDGPRMGRVSGTEMNFGFDPADETHYYIAGATDSGKSYTKRILVENCLSQGYNVLSITPSDTQALSAFKPYDDEGTGLAGDYYYFGEDILLDEPDDVSTLFEGANFVSLEGLSQSERQEFVKELFQEALKVEFSDNPVFVFLDEARRFSGGEAAAAIQEAVQETRKFNVHIVLVTQSPMHFQRQYKHIRENVSANFFLRGEYWEYAKNYLDSDDDIAGLEEAEAWFTAPGQSPVLLEIRKPLSRVEEVPRSDLRELDERFKTDTVDVAEFDSENPSFEESDTELSEEQEEVLKAIRRYTKREDRAPSQNKVIEEVPYGSSRTPRILSELEDFGVVFTEVEERGNNPATVFRISNADFV
jgi:hypothetical protein